MKSIPAADLQSRRPSPADGWFIIEAPGSYTNRTTEGHRVTQELTPDALAAIARAGVPAEGLPIDKDHLSLDSDNTTEAMGWVRELAMCGDSLAAFIQWTPLGLPLIQGRVYKHFSTVYPVPAGLEDGATFSPAALGGLALTNQPNNHGQPAITNNLRGTRYNLQLRSSARQSRATIPNSTSYIVPGKSTEPPSTLEESTTPNTQTMNPEILKLLGLPEDATEQDVISAIAELAQTAKDAEAAAEAAAESEAEQVITAEEQAANTELDPEEKEECKEHILANRKHGLNYTRLLCNSKRKPGTDRLYKGKTPAACAARNREQLVANRAQEICTQARAAGRTMNYWTAKLQAEREIGKEGK